MKNWILNTLKHYEVAKVTDEFINEGFPHPIRPTVAEMEEYTRASIVGVSTIVDKSKFAHIFRKSQKEQIEEFCKKNNLQHRFLYRENVHLFRKLSHNKDNNY